MATQRTYEQWLKAGNEGDKSDYNRELRRELEALERWLGVKESKEGENETNSK